MSLLTVAEVAKALRLSPPTIKKMIREGEIKGYMIGSRYRVEESDFNDYLDSSKATVTVSE